MFKLALDRGINEDPLFKIGKQNDFKIGASGAARAAAAAAAPLLRRKALPPAARGGR